jgi:predicted TIM-barrel fold metal-dependent hydrolase
MRGWNPSRRTVLRSAGGAALTGALGAGGGFLGRPAAGATESTWKGIVDSHIHVVPTDLPGELKETTQDERSLDAPAGKLAEFLRAEMKGAGIEHALCMPRREVSDEDPLGIGGSRHLAALVKDPHLHPVGLADPERTTREHLRRVEEQLKARAVVALKAYLGYLHHGPDSPGYRPYYELAANYQIPVIFHTGDTYSQRAKLRFAHPLLVDDVAVDHPQTRFVIAHMGNPWLTDAAAVLYKNNKKGLRENVWADLSGLIVGSAADFQTYKGQGALASVAAGVRKAFYYTERPDRFLYGSDWPLAPMASYRDFIVELVPEEHHQAVFRDNAKSLFGLA